MATIHVEKPDQAKLDALGVARWPIWTKEVSTFRWSYSSTEVAYVLEVRSL
jgi:uncharacterized cupin superfamily protein